MEQSDAPPKRRGRPLGSKYGPQVGSRPWLLTRLEPGARMFLEAPAGNLSKFMTQIATDIQRNGLKGKVTQTMVLGIVPATRVVIELVMITRLEEP